MERLSSNANLEPQLKCGELFQSIVVANGLVRKTVENHALNHLEALGFATRLEQDSLGLCYNAISSIGSAIQDVRIGSFGWAVVKSYYATFYAMRSILAADGVGFAYMHGTPIEVPSKPGKRFRKRKGQTHVAVYDLFRSRYPSDPIVVNDIAGEEPFNWLREKRELVNYRMQRFPLAGDDVGIFGDMATQKLRRVIESYLDVSTYAYDADHATIALPLACVSKCVQKAHGKALYKRDSQVAAARMLFVDGTGPIPRLISKFVDQFV